MALIGPNGEGLPPPPLSWDERAAQKGIRQVSSEEAVGMSAKRLIEMAEAARRGEPGASADLTMVLGLAGVARGRVLSELDKR